METKKIKVEDISEDVLAPKRARGGRASDYIQILDKVLKGEVLEITGLPYFRRNRFLRFTRGKNSDPKYAGKVVVLDTVENTKAFPQYQNKNGYKVVLIRTKDYEALKKKRAEPKPEKAPN